YVDGASDEEMMSFMEDVYQSQKNENDIFLSYQRTRMLNAILPNSNNYKEKLSIYKKSWFKFSAVAALLLITLTIGILFYNDNGFSEQNLVQQDFPLDIKPGGNKATLTLADGSVISLSETNAGKIAEQQGIVITKTDDGQILYTVDTKGEGSSEAEIVFNTIATPRGGQFQVILPDGTKVWLNAESSLKYPTVFSSKERKVELLGEGYFEVAKNENSPFIVITEDQAVTVLGTHFNINSYTKYNTETTLVEGSVKVSSVSASSVSKILKPGEQSVLNSQNKFNIKRVNLENAIAWKNGFF